jgi:hypothetical protein
MPAYMEPLAPVVLLAEAYAYGIEVRAIRDGSLGFTGPLEITPDAFQLQIWYNLPALTKYVTNMEKEIRS